MSTFFIEQFGCRATQADGAAIERQLREQGCSPAPAASVADVVVLNTCTVTAAADAQARDAIRKIHAANPATRILVTGCYAQRAPEEIAALPGVSFVVGNSHKSQIPKLVPSILAVSHIQLVGAELAPPPRSTEHEFPSHPAPILTGSILELTDVLVAPVLGGEGNHTRPTLKIQDGCNSRCSFCVIPFVRGKSRSLPPQTVLSEIQRLSDSGFREIVLSGINLGTYGRDLAPRVEFLELLRRILDETPVQRLRISSIEPLDVTQDLIDFFASNSRIAPHFHMPLQSASDRILAAMHRWYRAEHYARRVELIHDRLPNAAIGADVITGFPGESEADHAATIEFIAARPFTYLHVFSYSQRPGTKATSLPGQLPSHIIKNRARELRSLADSKSSFFRSAQIGRTLRVLTLRRDPAGDPRSTPALSENYLQVRLPVTLPPNQFVEAAVTRLEDNHLVAAAPAESPTFPVTGACS
ncbi:MAG TPA: tRNA (N(6)-L-threonylcarbamoyladenosine(37)-C(2))-methylthiotransferase MtaB [Candidatus Sulfotelmatobacter sp.]|jgi:threonylcarbamoyladenosine tRNA methylthiotransferase MtaB|nr:tRNA (N(6)-L-threonylcarbamoyladenosine(37)-C(2))-methylthiotransferase MtaB [Candidatus Sulfotelmatobacter sp.]